MNEKNNNNGYNDKIELVWELPCLILFFPLLNKADLLRNEMEWTVTYLVW